MKFYYKIYNYRLPTNLQTPFPSRQSDTVLPAPAGGGAHLLDGHVRVDGLQPNGEWRTQDDEEKQIHSLIYYTKQGYIRSEARDGGKGREGVSREDIEMMER